MSKFLELENARILVIGGAGFVGSNLCHELLNHNPSKITIVDNLLSSETDNIPKNEKINFIYGSISDDKIILSLPKNFDYIFHLATYHGNQSSIENPLEDHDNNTLTTLKICEYFKDSTTLKKIVYSSAGCVVAEKTYNEPNATDENTSVSLYLDSPYQISKVIGEFYGNYYFMKYKLPFVKARFQNVYGPREILGAGKWRGTYATVWRNVTPTFIWKIIHREKITLDNNGETTRDFIYVEDIVNGLILCALKGKSGEVYNLASGIETPIKELATSISEICKKELNAEYKEARNWDRSGRRYGETSKSDSELGFKCKYNLKEGLQKTIDWTNDNYDMIERNIKKHDYFM
jgi:UDP-glucose 4-epimerase